LELGIWLEIGNGQFILLGLLLPCSMDYNASPVKTPSTALVWRHTFPPPASNTYCNWEKMGKSPVDNNDETSRDPGIKFFDKI